MDYQKAIKEAEIQIDMYEGMILYNKDFEPKMIIVIMKEKLIS